MTQTNTSWQKGVTGNAKGRPPKGYSISETVREMFESTPDLKKKLVKAMIDKAIDGDMTACKMIWSYADGLPRQSIEFPEKRGLSDLLHIYAPIRDK